MRTKNTFYNCESWLKKLGVVAISSAIMFILPTYALAGDSGDGQPQNHEFGVVLPDAKDPVILNIGAGGADVELFGRDCCMRDDIVKVYVDDCLIGTIDATPWGPPHAGETHSVWLEEGEHTVDWVNTFGWIPFGVSGWQLEENESLTSNAEPLPTICKRVDHTVIDQDGNIVPDGNINSNVGNSPFFERVKYKITITVRNPSDSGETWKYVKVEDRFAGDLTFDFVPPGGNNPCADLEAMITRASDNSVELQKTVYCRLKGKTEKIYLKWSIGKLYPGDVAKLMIPIITDINPGGQYEYTSCSFHDINSGSVLKYKIQGEPGQQSASTPRIEVSVLEDDLVFGDCDGDMCPDGWEVFEFGTNPHEFNCEYQPEHPDCEYFDFESNPPIMCPMNGSD